MPQYDVPVILTVEAENYTLAVDEAGDFAEGTNLDTEGGIVAISVADVYDRDNDGQRVLYLDDERDEPYAVGIVDSAEVVARFGSLGEAESFIEAADDYLVRTGYYFIDGSEREDV